MTKDIVTLVILGIAYLRKEGIALNEVQDERTKQIGENPKFESIMTYIDLNTSTVVDNGLTFIEENFNEE